MTTSTQSANNKDLILAARQGLLPVGESTWLGGFGNLLNKELGEWFGTRRWIVQGLIWLLIINGLMAFIMFIVPTIDPSQAFPPQEAFDQGAQLFYGFASIFSVIGMVILAQDEVIGEKQSGTAAWVLSKPISRSAFILTKLFSNLIGASILILGIPGIVAYIEIYLVSGMTLSIPVLPFLASLGVVLSAMTFFLTLTLMLGTFFEQRGPVLGIAVGVMVGGWIFNSFLQPVGYILPVNTHVIAGLVAMRQPLPLLGVSELLSTILLSIAFTAVALWRFGREEF